MIPVPELLVLEIEVLELEELELEILELGVLELFAPELTWFPTVNPTDITVPEIGATRLVAARFASAVCTANLAFSKVVKLLPVAPSGTDSPFKAAR